MEISAFDDEATDLIVGGRVDCARRFVTTNQEDINLPYLLSFVIHRSMYLESVNGLPVSVDWQLVSLGDMMSRMRVDNDDDLSYALSNGDMSIPLFLLYRGVVDMETLRDMMVVLPRGVESLRYIDDIYLRALK